MLPFLSAEGRDRSATQETVFEVSGPDPRVERSASDRKGGGMVHSVAAGVMFMLLACTPGSAHSDISPGAEADTSESPVVEIGNDIYKVGNEIGRAHV